MARDLGRAHSLRQGTSMVRPARGGIPLFALLSLALSALPATARAGDDDTRDSSDDPPAVVPVSIRSLAPGEYAEISKVGKKGQPDEFVVQCPEDCDKTVAPGRYRLRLYDASGRQVGSTGASILWPTTFRASDPESRALAGWGIGMGVAGAVAMSVGRFTSPAITPGAAGCPSP